MTFYEMIEKLNDENDYAVRLSQRYMPLSEVYCIILGGLNGNIYYVNENNTPYEFSKEDFYATDWVIE